VHVFGCIAVVYTFTSLVTQGDGGRSCMRETDARGARLTRATTHLTCLGTVPCERVIAGVGGVHTAMFEADNLPVLLGWGGSTNLADGRSSMALVRTAEVNQNCSLVVASYPSPAPTDPQRRGGQPTVDDGQWPLLVGRGKLCSVSGTNGPSTQGGPADGRRRPVAATCRSRQAILPLRHQRTLDAGGPSRRSANDQWPPLATNDCLTKVPPLPWQNQRGPSTRLDPLASDIEIRGRDHHRPHAAARARRGGPARPTYSTSPTATSSLRSRGGTRLA